jgi:hypothetical protein
VALACPHAVLGNFPPFEGRRRNLGNPGSLGKTKALVFLIFFKFDWFIKFWEPW